MEALVVPDVEQRGLALGPDHLPNASEKFDWLEGTLERIGDLGSLRLIRSVRELSGNELSRANALCREYANRADFRMAALERYMLTQGVKLAWTRDDT